ncbi:hypothetical protein CLV58_1194 [Spirosoma oryzae]|uniref:Uncharacterized protein n=1 Tax=Spirosoma oryzae TaxID=1469603 RepID=A0A2T0SKD1_9BACT|nr:hypothetical protein [Spirosoma oryzae]PRY33855.1 hypothetical protein CLV58_1194 [Spirosoma oryzae]
MTVEQLTTELETAGSLTPFLASFPADTAILIANPYESKDGKPYLRVSLLDPDIFTGRYRYNQAGDIEFGMHPESLTDQARAEGCSESDVFADGKPCLIFFPKPPNAIYPISTGESQPSIDHRRINE